MECVRLLLQAGADPNALVHGTAETALHACVIGLGANVTESDRYQVVKLLIEHGADPNRRTIPGVQTLAGTIQLVVSSAAQWIWPVCKA